jgi:hypothetical protein
MPRFYFHLSAPDQVFNDDLGTDLTDLTAAHARALLLADRVMAIFPLTDRTSDFRRWTVKITDQAQQPLIIVKFPAHFPRRKRALVPSKGMRPLLRHLEAMLRASRQAAAAGAGEDSARPQAQARRTERWRARAP